ncbi:mucin-15 [Gouania willdenowi]|uniref:mucin-15 n=1 Tax=Gouania willdenowi TaxID=441366 RepID=UPI001055715D|nr:mucin-15 [Gouania willdenowi]
MRLLKTTACFLLLFQTFDLAALQTTSRPRPTIDPSWLRQQLPAVSAFSGDGDSTNDSSETTSGALDEDASTNTNETDNDGGFVQTTVTNVNLNETNQQQQPAETNSTESLNSTQTNTTEWIETNSTNAESALNATDIPATTPSGHNDNVNSTMASNDHMSPNTTLIVTPQQNATTNTSSAPPDAVTTATEDGGVTTPVLDVSVKINVNDQGSGDESGREGSVSDSSNNHRKVAWAAVLGTGIVVAFIGLVVYVMMKRKQRKDFYHRKLVEEFPSDPVHRLDNNDSLELEFGRSAFYNPTLQEDDIQMSNLPKRI